jgi:hypothetical protein
MPLKERPMSPRTVFRSYGRPLGVAFLLALLSAIPVGAVPSGVLAQGPGYFCPTYAAMGMYCPPAQTTTQATSFVSCPDGTIVAATQGCSAGVYTTVPTPSSVSFPISPFAASPLLGQTQSELIPLPPYQYVWVYNPWNGPAVVSGADVVWAYDYSWNSYYQTSAVPPGGGAWLFSYGGGEATLTPIF